MAWVVDTCVLIDVLDADERFGEASSQCLDSLRSQGLVLCPVSYVELAPSFIGDTGLQNLFLNEVGVDFDIPWEWKDTLTAHNAWSRYVEMKRNGKMKRKPVADVQIGAFASRFGGLITRNGADFKLLFPELNILEPTQSKEFAE